MKEKFSIKKNRKTLSREAEEKERNTENTHVTAMQEKISRNKAQK
jgi:hypothetical protein